MCTVSPTLPLSPSLFLYLSFFLSLSLLPSLLLQLAKISHHLLWDWPQCPLPDFLTLPLACSSFLAAPSLSHSRSRSCLLFQLSSLCAQRYANYGKLSRLVFALFQARLVPSAASVALRLMPMLISFLLSHLHSPRMHFNCTFSCCCQQLITGNLLKCLRPATTLLSAQGQLQGGKAKESRTMKGAYNRREGERSLGVFGISLYTILIKERASWDCLDHGQARRENFSTQTRWRFMWEIC